VDTPLWLQAFVDDAAIFPPASTPLDQAVTEHAVHRSSEYAGFVGGFVVSDVKVADLAKLATGPDPLAVNLVVTGGAGAIEPAVTWVGRSEGLELRAVEFALRDEEDLAHNAGRLVKVVDSLGEALDDVQVFAEPPIPPGMPSHGWLAALDELAAREISLKFRTGGLSDELFPTSSQLASCIEASLDRELPFKCTAGLHHAVRHRDHETGFEHLGFLNVLLATRVAFDGGTVAETTQVLDDHYANDLVALARQSDLEGARRWFTSYGSCSVSDPLEDLVGLGLLEAPHG